jgi:hypothetical protein
MRISSGTFMNAENAEHEPVHLAGAVDVDLNRPEKAVYAAAIEDVRAVTSPV